MLAARAADPAWAGQAAGAPDDPRLARPATAGTKPTDESEARPTARAESSPGRSKSRRVYQVSLGPWSWQFSVPESIDLLDIADRVRGFFGMLAILGVARLSLGQPPRDLAARRLLGAGPAMGLRPAGPASAGRRSSFSSSAGKAVKSILDCALDGRRVRLRQGLGRSRGAGRDSSSRFRVLPTVIFVAALFAVLYHLGVMQWIVRGFAVVMAWLMGTSGAESLNVAASLFLGQTEAPLTIRPYLPRLTQSELLTVMTSGMAHVSGGVMAAYIAFGVEARHILTAVIMTAPGAILISKMLVPETEKPETLGTVSSAETSTDANVLDAASRGTRDGLHLALNIAAMLIAFLGLIALVNMGLAFVGHVAPGDPRLGDGPGGLPAGRPLGGLQGRSASCSGTRTVLNELIAFSDLGELKASTS